MGSSFSSCKKSCYKICWWPEIVRLAGIGTLLHLSHRAGRRQLRCRKGPAQVLFQLLDEALVLLAIDVSAMQRLLDLAVEVALVVSVQLGRLWQGMARAAGGGWGGRAASA